MSGDSGSCRSRLFNQAWRYRDGCFCDLCSLERLHRDRMLKIEREAENYLLAVKGALVILLVGILMMVFCLFQAALRGA